MNPETAAVQSCFVAKLLDKNLAVVARHLLSSRFPTEAEMKAILLQYHEQGARYLDMDALYSLTGEAGATHPAYVYAQYPGNPKEYCWDNPNARRVVPGDTVLVASTCGQQALTVCRTSQQRRGHRPHKSILRVLPHGQQTINP